MSGERIECKYTHHKPFRLVGEDGGRQMVYDGEKVKVTQATINSMPERFEKVQQAAPTQKSASTGSGSGAQTSG